MDVISVLKQQQTTVPWTRMPSKNKITNQLKQGLIKTLITEWGIWSNHSICNYTFGELNTPFWLFLP